jgi:hypothetical protein
MDRFIVYKGHIQFSSYSQSYVYKQLYGSNVVSMGKPKNSEKLSASGPLKKKHQSIYGLVI